MSSYLFSSSLVFTLIFDSFQCTSLAFLLLNLYLFHSFWCYCKWNCFPNFSLDCLLMRHRNTIDFLCIYIECCNLLNFSLLLVIACICVCILGFSIYKIMLSTDSFTSFFPVCIFLLTFSSVLIFSSAVTNLLQALLLNSYFLVLYFSLLGCPWVILIYSIKFIFGNSLVKLHLVFKFLKLITVVFKSKYDNVNLWVLSGFVSIVCFSLAMGYCFLVCLLLLLLLLSRFSRVWLCATQ